MSKLEEIRRKLAEQKLKGSQEIEVIDSDPYTEWHDMVYIINTFHNHQRYGLSHKQWICDVKNLFSYLPSQGNTNIKGYDDEYEMDYDLNHSILSIYRSDKENEVKLSIRGCTKTNIIVNLNEKQTSWKTKKLVMYGHCDIVFNKEENTITYTDWKLDNKPVYQFTLDWTPLTEIPEWLEEQLTYMKMKEII